MPLRKHQHDFGIAIDEKIAGATFKTILVRATPGGGKSTLPIQATKLIKAGLADRVCWVVPRDALRNQGERNFLDPTFRKMFNHNYSVRSSSNEVRPCRGTSGFITTYQALGVDVHHASLAELRRLKYILVLDEFHHCELNGRWTEEIQPLVDAAVLVILMTGTLQRGDNKPIAFIPYKETKEHGFVEYSPDLDAPGLKYIEYTRADALREKAIIPMQFYFHNGSAEFKKGEQRISVPSIADALPKQVGPALYTALRTDYARELLEYALTHWVKWKKKIKTSKMLVVCADYETALETTRFIRKIMPHRSSDIATSHDSSAQYKIKGFRNGKTDILVTIAMAYEGLSVEQITHIACLTHIRSTPWIEQMVARANRIDRAYQYGGQVAHIFSPDDHLFRKIVARIEQEQIQAIDNYAPGRHREEPEQMTLFDEGLDDVKPGLITPIDSKMTSQREWFLGNPEPSHECLEEPEPVTPKEAENDLRRGIEKHVRAFCRANRYKQGVINGDIKNHFGKSRTQMNNAELAAVLSFVQNNYPIGYQSRGSYPPIDRTITIENG